VIVTPWRSTWFFGEESNLAEVKTGYAYAFTQYHTTSCAELAGIPRFDVHEMISQEKWAQLDDLLQQWWTICNAINII